MQDVYSSTEIIFAAAILTSLLIGGIACVIVVITGSVKTLVSLMVSPTREKRSRQDNGIRG